MYDWPLNFGILIFFNMQLGNHGSNLTEEELETHTIAAWKQRKPQMRVDGQGRVLPRCLIHVRCFKRFPDFLLFCPFKEVSIINNRYFLI